MAGILALDLHKDYIYGYHERPDGKVRRFRFSNGREQWKDLARQHIDSETRVIFEATGGAFALYDIVSPLAKEVVIANPLELKRYGSGRHTDKVDVERMATMLVRRPRSSFPVGCGDGGWTIRSRACILASAPTG